MSATSSELDPPREAKHPTGTLSRDVAGYFLLLFCSSFHIWLSCCAKHGPEQGTHLCNRLGAPVFLSLRPGILIWGKIGQNVQKLQPRKEKEEKEERGKIRKGHILQL